MEQRDYVAEGYGIDDCYEEVYVNQSLMPVRQQDLFGQSRVIAWFSCGASSAVAAKLAIEHYGYDAVTVAYCDTSASEHPDNMRFLADCEQWLQTPIVKLKHPLYGDIYDVFELYRFLKNYRGGTQCTIKLKKDVRKAFQRDSDIHVFGFTNEEDQRRVGFQDANPELTCAWPLIYKKLTRKDCIKIIQNAGVELPMMYRLGYRNNNCIGCVKGGAGYWNKIRVDFPDVFAKMAVMERAYGFAMVKVKQKPCFLDELPPDAGRYEPLLDMSCGPHCVIETAE